MLAVRQSDLVDCIGLPSIHPRERRTHSRITVSLAGRLMLENGTETVCRTIDISLSGMRLRTPAKVVCGERVIAYLDHFGRTEGFVTRLLPEGFALKLVVPAARLRRYGELLMLIGNRDCIATKEDRRHGRIVPTTDKTVIEFINRTQAPASILNLSRSGARLATAARPPVGARVVVGNTTCDVVRHFETGVAVEFLRAIPEDLFDEHFVP